MTLSFWQRGARERDREFDVAVVGGGIIGCSTAYWLGRLRPELRVAIVEAGRLAHGASGRNAGFLLQGTSRDYQTDLEAHGPDLARRLWHFTRENRDLIASEVDTSAIEFEASGSLTVAGTPEEDERLRTVMPRMRADGAPVAYIQPDEVSRRLSSRGFFGALYVPSGATINPVRLVQHLAAESGATILEHHAVAALDSDGRTATLETTQGHIRVRQVILALNAYLPKLLPGLSRYVKPVRAQMFATKPATPRWLPVPAYSHDGFYYIRQTREGAILLGGARHLHLSAEVGYEDQVTPGLQADLETYLREHFPLAEGARVEHRWSGVMGFSPDHLPVIGEVPELPGSFWAAGFTGHGMGYGFRFGRLVAELTLGYPRPDGYDLFTSARFAEPAAEEAAARKRA